MERATSSFCATCGDGPVFADRRCARCGKQRAPKSAVIPVAPLRFAPRVQWRTASRSYLDSSVRDADIAAMWREGWQVQRLRATGQTWHVVYQSPVPGTPKLSPIDEVSRAYSDPGARDRDIERMGRYGWDVQRITLHGGKRNRRRGVFGLFDTTLALLAGAVPDQWVVVYTTTIPLGKVLLPYTTP
jgi:hypothetical protein